MSGCRPVISGLNWPLYDFTAVCRVLRFYLLRDDHVLLSLRVSSVRYFSFSTAARQINAFAYPCGLQTDRVCVVCFFHAALYPVVYLLHAIRCKRRAGSYHEGSAQPRSVWDAGVALYILKTFYHPRLCRL